MRAEAAPPAPRPLGPCLIRSAALPFEALEAWGTGEPGERRARVAAALRRWAESERLALWLASPSLLEALGRPTDERSGPALDRSLLRYAARMCGRATPYGAFAGVSVGRVGASTSLALDPAGRGRLRVQLDARLALELAARWQADPRAREGQRVTRVAQVSPVGDRVRCAPLALGDQEASLIELPRTPHLEGLLEASREGLTAAGLAERLARWQPRASEAARRRFVERLLEAGVLFTELVPSATGAAVAEQLIEALERSPALGAERAALIQVKNDLDAIGPAATVEGLEAIGERLRAEPLGASSPALFHAELWRPLAAGTVGPAVAAEMVAVASFLAGLPPARQPRLAAFARRLEGRYDTRLVPLLEALDEDHGVGLDGEAWRPDLPLLEGLPRGGGGAGGEELDTTQQALLRRLLGALARGEREIALDDGFEAREAGRGLPACFTVVASLASAPGAEADRGKLWLLRPVVTTASGAATLARFAGHDAGLEGALRAYVRAEEEACDDVLADVVDLVPDGVANVARRPSVARYEVVLGGRSGAPREGQIGVDELLVGVEGGRVILVSPRLGRRVRLRATHALDMDHARATPLQRLVALLQRQDHPARSRLAFGPLAHASPFVPRLSYRRSILQPARWLLEAGELPAEGAGAAALAGAAGALRERRGLPRWVSLTADDNVLPLDLDNPVAVEVLQHELGVRRRVALEEFLPAALPRALAGPGGTYVHELVVPFVSAPSPAAEASSGERAGAGRAAGAAAAVPPGGSPLYAKIHGATAALESFLVEEAPALIEGATSWFFVRYEDAQGPHLRLRLFGDPATLWGPVVRRLEERVGAAMARGALGGLQLDTYRPEVERYGGPAGLALSEQVFWADSACALALVGLGPEPEARWRLAARSVEALLDDLGLSGPERLALYERGASTLRREVGDEALRHALGEQFRRRRHDLARALAAGGDAASEALAARSARVRPLAGRLRDLRAAGELPRTLATLARLHVHMCCNRLLDHAPRAQEMALYSLLERHHRAQRARGLPR